MSGIKNKIVKLDFYDFIFIAKPKTDKIVAGDGESQDFRWFSKEDLLSEDLKPHIKNTALAVLEYLSKKDLI